MVLGEDLHLISSTYLVAQNSATVVLRDLMSSSAFHETRHASVLTHIYRQNTHTHLKKQVCYIYIK